jgi:hypothetical protein
MEALASFTDEAQCEAGWFSCLRDAALASFTFLFPVGYVANSPKYDRQILDYSGWFSNPLRFNVFALLYQRNRGNALLAPADSSKFMSSTKICKKNWLAREASRGLEPLPVLRTWLEWLESRTKKIAWLERDLSKIMSVSKKPLHRLIQSFPKHMFCLKTK